MTAFAAKSSRLPSSLVIESARQSRFGFSLRVSRLALLMNASDFSPPTFG